MPLVYCLLLRPLREVLLAVPSSALSVSLPHKGGKREEGGEEEKGMRGMKNPLSFSPRSSAASLAYWLILALTEPAL